MGKFIKTIYDLFAVGGAAGWLYGGPKKDGTPSRIFYGYVLFSWRDGKGINPRIHWHTFQDGQPDKHLLPFGSRCLDDELAFHPYRFRDAK